jgi:hypothetical protein
VDGSKDELVTRRGRIDADLPGPTPAEGVAAIHAFRWLSEAERLGTIREQEPVAVLIDNAPVASKAESGNTRGKFAEVWEELARVTEPFRTNEGRLRIRRARTWQNRADALAVRHDHAESWDVPTAPCTPRDDRM